MAEDVLSIVLARPQRQRRDERKASRQDVRLGRTKFTRSAANPTLNPAAEAQSVLLRDFTGPTWSGQASAGISTSVVLGSVSATPPTTGTPLNSRPSAVFAGGEDLNTGGTGGSSHLLGDLISTTRGSGMCVVEFTTLAADPGASSRYIAPAIIDDNGATGYYVTFHDAGIAFGLSSTTVAYECNYLFAIATGVRYFVQWYHDGINLYLRVNNNPWSILPADAMNPALLGSFLRMGQRVGGGGSSFKLWAFSLSKTVFDWGEFDGQGLYYQDLFGENFGFSATSGVPSSAIDPALSDDVAGRWSDVYLAPGIVEVFTPGAYTLTADSGSFGLGGQAATLRVAMPATQASYALTGQDATLRVAMPATQASYALTGQAATLAVAMPAAQASFALTGQAATLRVSMAATVAAFALTGTITGLTSARRLTAAQASFALSGQDATLRVSMAAVQASFALTGNVVSLLSARRIAIVQASFSLTGVAAAFAVAMPATQASYALTGFASTLRVAMPATQAAFALTGNVVTLAVAMPATQASYALTGNAAALTSARRLTATQASFALTGQAVTFRVTLAAVQASFALTGQDATLHVVMPATQAAFALSGQAAILGVTMPAAQASFALTGTTTGLVYSGGGGGTNYTLTTIGAAFALTGNAVALLKASILPSTATAFALTGQALTFRTSRVLSTAVTPFTVAGTTTSLLVDRRLTATQAAFALTGEAVTFRRGFAMVAVAGSMSLSGSAITLRADRRIVVEAGTFALDGGDVSLSRGYILTTEPGAFELSGFPVALVKKPRAFIALGPVVPLVEVHVGNLHGALTIRVGELEPLITVRVGRITSENPLMGLKVGAVAVIPITVRLLGTKIDPDAYVRITILDPDGIETTYTLGTNPEVEQVTDGVGDPVLGQFRAKIPCSKRGTWHYTWEVNDTDGAGVEGGYYDVEAAS